MLRLFIVGSRADRWEAEFAPWQGGRLEVRSAARPARALRCFETLAPDAVGLAAEPDAAAELLAALRERPLGRLVPIVALEPFDAAGELEADRYLEEGAGATEAVRALEAQLEVELSEPPGQRGPPREEGPDEEEIGAKLEDVRRRDYFTVLELERAAGGDAVEEAFRRLRRRFAGERVDNRLADRYRRELQMIADGLTDAYQVLAHPDVRRRYTRHLRTEGSDRADEDG